MNSLLGISRKLCFQYDIAYNNIPLFTLCHVVHATLGLTIVHLTAALGNREGRNWGAPFLFHGNRVNGECAGLQIHPRSSADQERRSTKSEVESSNLAGATDYRERSITGQGKNIGGASQYFTLSSD